MTSEPHFYLCSFLSHSLFIFFTFSSLSVLISPFSQLFLRKAIFAFRNISFEQMGPLSSSIKFEAAVKEKNWENFGSWIRQEMVKGFWRSLVLIFYSMATQISGCRHTQEYWRPVWIIPYHRFEWKTQAIPFIDISCNFENSLDLIISSLWFDPLK